jgi:hypothetical protein
MRHTPGFDATGLVCMLAQHTQHTPLLVRQAMLAQAGAGVEHHRLTGFEQKSGQVAVGKRRFVTHLFNMLNE